MLLKVIEFSIVLLLTLQNEASADEVRELTGLEPKMTLEINGVVQDVEEDYSYEKYQIDLQEAGNDTYGGDIDLHISVRYGMDKLVLNSWLNGEWGPEETYTLRYRKYHKLLITARAKSFLITINGEKIFFKYRKPVETLGKIKSLIIGGQIQTGFIDLDATTCP